MTIFIRKVFWIVKNNFFSYGYPISGTWACRPIAPHRIYNTVYLKINLRINYQIQILLQFTLSLHLFFFIQQLMLFGDNRPFGRLIRLLSTYL